MARVFSGTQRCRCTDLTFIIIAFFTFFVYVVEGMNQPTMSSSTAQSATAENIAREEVHETHTFAALGEEIEGKLCIFIFNGFILPKSGYFQMHI